MVCASPTSAVRSWVMMGASKLGRSVGRRAHAPFGMALTGIALCLGNPTCACDLGFLFLTLSVCALALFSCHAEAVLSRLGPRSKLFKRARRWCYRHTPRVSSFLRSAARTTRATFAATLVCQIATLPLSAATFSSISLVAPLANVVVGPLFMPIVSVGVCACCLMWVPVVGPFLVSITAELCSCAVWLTRTLAALPLACVLAQVDEWWELSPLNCCDMSVVCLASTFLQRPIGMWGGRSRSYGRACLCSVYFCFSSDGRVGCWSRRCDFSS